MDVQKQRWSCDICSVFCTSGPDLFEHVSGRKHRINASRVSLECLSSMDKLQYIFDTYLTLEPLVGLEYIEERKKKGSSPLYQCLLCAFHGQMKQIFSHITGPHHIAKYLEKHHPEFCVRSVSQKSKLLPKHRKVIQQAAVKVCQQYGRKKIIEVNADGSRGPTRQKTSNSGPKTESSVTPDIIRDVHTGSLQKLEQKGSDHPAEVFGFKGNGEFLDFLQKFEIQSDEDAWFIKQITQNCTQALVRFREEQTQPNQVPGGPPAPANEPGKGSSVSARGAGKVAPTPGMQNNALEVFFNSIKNMELSEVGTILQGIAATNPAFRGINVPSVIKYLQATGRLKTS